jgi:hypothetical protein
MIVLIRGHLVYFLLSFCSRILGTSFLSYSHLSYSLESYSLES